ncbi:hypothetical protein LUR56_18465, partial [Streptomyces sp. MT29]|nr:hypothetical protein [Streptomyces sp. MT29]
VVPVPQTRRRSRPRARAPAQEAARRPVRRSRRGRRGGDRVRPLARSRPARTPVGGRLRPARARFGGGPAEAAEEAPAPAALPDPGAGEAVAAAVGRLVRLRAEGRSGEAHVVLYEVAAWPAPRLPVLADALYRAGLAADWTTLLWEASSLPPAGFAAAAGGAGRGGPGARDSGLLLRQGVARPAAEVAEAVLALDGAGREGAAWALLGAFVRVRTPQEAAEIAGGGGDRVLPHLLRRPARCRWSGSGT